MELKELKERLNKEQIHVVGVISTGIRELPTAKYVYLEWSEKKNRWYEEWYKSPHSVKEYLPMCDGDIQSATEELIHRSCPDAMFDVNVAEYGYHDYAFNYSSYNDIDEYYTAGWFWEED